MKTVVYSHGFGVDATSRGMFTDIAAAPPDIKFVMFNYNTFDEAGNMTVRPLPEQARMLNEQLLKAEGEVTLLSHSMGCAVAAMADLSKVARAIFLAPPGNGSFSKEHFAQKFGSREGAVYDPEGMSSIPRRDGTTTYVGKEYLDALDGVAVEQLYEDAASNLPLTVICAADDEILAKASLKVPGANNLAIPGDHDFNGAARQGLIAKLGDLL
ncbi:MAG TPA: hypothetical protein VLF40_00620 [Candidatus Saccharimonadales bacterium]|nr:hypothetical protein [Candidatus Saccharimonadales bacterium]